MQRRTIMKAMEAALALTSLQATTAIAAYLGSADDEIGV